MSLIPEHAPRTLSRSSAAAQPAPDAQSRARRGLAAASVLLLGAVAVAASLLPQTAQAQSSASALADGPIFNNSVPGNLAFLLSNEYPTAENDANWGNYDDTKNYAGYFDPNKCYVYQLDTAQHGRSYFKPITHAGGANKHFCDPDSLSKANPPTARSNFPNAKSSGLWSGNFMNWASMQTIDAVRWKLTGGYRVVDRDSESDTKRSGATGTGSPLTILEKAWSSRFYVGKPSSQMRGTRLMKSWNADYAVQYTVEPGLIKNLTPFGEWVKGKWWRNKRGDKGAIDGGFFTFIKGMGNRMEFSPVDATLWYPTNVPTLWGTSTSSLILNGMNVGADNIKYKKDGTPNDAVDDELLQPPRSTFDTSYDNDADDQRTLKKYWGWCSLSNNPYPCYQVFVRVSVCENRNGLDGLSLLEANCVRYGKPSEHYKPEGLFQKYANQLRYSMFSYPRDATNNTILLRAPMRFIGPTVPNINPSNAATTNAYREWDPDTGVMGLNPDSAMGRSIPNSFPANSLATGKVVKRGDSAVNGGPVAIVNMQSKEARPTQTSQPNLYYDMDANGQSGFMNYLNKYGIYYGYYNDKAYKIWDVVDDLYYAALRYYRNQGNPWSVGGSSNTTKLPPGDDGLLAHAATDAFPFVTTWSDPILYRCQKNFILGISDTHTWNGKQTSKFTDIPEIDSEQKGGIHQVDTWVNRVGNMEGMNGRWPANAGPAPASDRQWPRWDGNKTMMTRSTYYTAGMAYYLHVNDIRTDLPALGKLNGKVTVDTYWVDVTEFNAVEHLNPYLLAAKYGGFSVPSNYNTSSTTPLQQSWWNTPGKTLRTHLRGDPTSYKGGTPNESFSDDSDEADTTTSNSSGGDDNTPCGGASLKSCWQTVSKGRYPKPDNYFTASDSSAMAAGLDQAFASMVSALKAYSTAFSLASSSLDSGGSGSYTAKYSAANWTSTISGSNLTIATDANGNDTVSQALVWNSDDMLSTQFLTQYDTYEDDGTGTDTLIYTPAYLGWDSNRRVVTWNGRQGARFVWDELSAAQQAALYPLNYGGKSVILPNGGKDYVSYLRGDRTNEIGSNIAIGANRLRARDLLLGDIVNSKITVVGAPQMLYTDNYNPGYQAFKNGKALTRTTAIYVGANDGMMHAFDASLTKADGGYEIFAYVPSLLFQTLPASAPTGTSSTTPNNALAWLGNPDYNTAHHFSVDATPLAFDVDFNRAGNPGGAVPDQPDWRTILVGGLGKGGKGFYAIDVTDPDDIYRGLVNPAAKTVENNAAAKVLWEFTASDMGYSYGAPIAVKTAQYGWVIALTSGYGNSDGKGHLYLVNPKTGALLQKIDTPTASDGLAQATAYVADYSNYVADAIYAGDLNGQLWRFDLSNPSATPSSATLLATLTDASGAAQPITTGPMIEIHPDTNKRYVLVGTGKLLGTGDTAAPYKMQSFYAVIDGAALAFGTAGTPVTRDDLTPVRDATAGLTTVPDTSKGWYLDLSSLNDNFVKPSASSSASASGERVVTSAVAYEGMVAFSTQLITPDPCLPAVGNLYMLDFANGKTALSKNGQPIGYVKLQNLVTDMLFTATSDGNVRLLVGDNQGNVQSYQVPSRGSSVKILNWRSVPMGGN